MQLIDAASKVTGQEYVYKYIQQLGIGAFMELYPQDFSPSPTVNHIVKIYDKDSFEKRIRELKGEAYN
ncbi:MAG: hypothetical protein Q8R18_03785 [bacterium]|nr:hypothetical protein [bacterium]